MGIPPPGKSVGKYPLLYFYNLRPGNRQLFKKTCHFSEKRVTFLETGHFFGNRPTFSGNRPKKWKRVRKCGQFRRICKKVMKRRKKRPLAVTNIFMPDFRHAHTLQQSERDTPDRFICLVVSFSVSCCLDLDSSSFVVLLRHVIETRGGTRNMSNNCCSVWAWRKSGIKMLVTARGLFFLFSIFFYKFVEIGHILRPIFIFPPRFREKVTEFREKWRISGKVVEFIKKWADFPKSGPIFVKSVKSGSFSLKSPRFSINFTFYKRPPFFVKFDHFFVTFFGPVEAGEVGYVYIYIYIYRGTLAPSRGVTFMTCFERG